MAGSCPLLFTVRCRQERGADNRRGSRMGSGLRTTVVGSWWPQAEYEASLHQVHRGVVAEHERESIFSACAQQAIDQQIELGLTEWTGGEVFHGRISESHAENADRHRD